MAMKDNQIVESILKREEKGMDILYDKYSPALYGMISRRVRNQDVAEELLQETMLKAWNKISLYDPNKGKLFTWLSTIARNTTLDKLRLKKYQQQSNIDPIDNNANPASTILLSDQIDASQLLSSLDPKYEIVLRMSYLEGYSHSEIAKELDMPLGTVKSRIRKAIKTLRVTLAKEKKLFIGIFLSILLITLLCN